MKNIYVILFFLLAGNSLLLAQEFEGELDYQVHDASGKNSIMKVYRSKGHEKISGLIGLLPVDFYFTTDSMALIFPKENEGIILCVDSAKTFFASNFADTLIATSITAGTEIISGYHCTCITGSFSSGKKNEYWFTTEIDPNVCTMFAQSTVGSSMVSDGTVEFTKGLNLEGKFIICTRILGTDGGGTYESTLTKITQRTVIPDEINISPDIPLARLNPDVLRMLHAKGLRKI